MTTIFKACYYQFAAGPAIPLTGPEHSQLSDRDLKRVAIERARKLGIIPNITEKELRAGLQIGFWERIE